MKLKRLSLLCMIVFLLNIMSPMFSVIKLGSISSYAAAASIVIDASSSAKTTASGIRLSWNHTVSSSITNKMLIVAVGAEGSNVTVSSVKYNGVTMNLATGVTASTASPYDRAAIYYLANPPSGTYSIVITMATSSTGITGRGMSLGNVYQGAPEYNITGYTNSGTSISTTINSSVGSLVVSSMSNSSPTTTNTAGTGLLNVVKNAATNSHSAGSATKIASTSSTVMNWTSSATSQKIAHAVASFKVFIAPTPTPTPSPSPSPTPIPTNSIILDSSSSAKTAASATSLSWNHTVSGTLKNKMLIVAVGAEGSNVTVSSVKYNGVALTQAIGVSASTASPYDRAAIYYLANPPSGTYSIVITMAASSTGITGRAISLGNVFQGAPEYKITGFTNSGASISTTITSSVGSWIVSAMSNSSPTATNTAGTGLLNVVKTAATNSHSAGSATKVATTTSTVMNWTSSVQSQKIAHAVASFKLAPVPTPTPVPTATPKPTATSTSTPVPTATPTSTPRPTSTPTSTPVPTATPTSTPVPTATPTSTPVPTATPTSTPVPTATPTSTPVPTSTPTPVPTSTLTPVPTVTPTPTPTTTSTPTPTPTSTQTSTPTPNGRGTISREYWSGVVGTNITDLTLIERYPNNPSLKDELTSFEVPVISGDNYGTRVRGYIYPPVSGTYTFYIASDDTGELYLSTDESAENKRKTAYVSGPTSSREWTKFPEQKSESIYLVAGQKYYIEALQKEGDGGDNLAVAWESEGITRQVIPGSYLSPFGSKVEAPKNLVVKERGSTFISLEWLAPENKNNLSGYIIYKNGTEIGRTANTWCVDNGIVGQGSEFYSYFVKAYDNSEILSPESNLVSVNANDVSTISAVSNISIVLRTTSSIGLSWTASSSSDVKEYEIYRNGNYLDHTSDTNFNDSGLNSGTKYDYAVRAISGSGNMSADIYAITGSTVYTTPPAAAINLNYSAKTESTVFLIWDNGNEKDEIGVYDVYRDDVKIASTPVKYYQDTDLNSYTTYKYYVVAKDIDGNSSLQSNQISVKPEKTSTSIIQRDYTNLRFVKVVSLASTCLAISDDGTMWGWGNNLYGAFGNGTFVSSYTPIALMQDVKDIKMYDFKTFVIKKDNSLWIWGKSNLYGSIGNGTELGSITPVKIMEGVKDVFPSSGGTNALKLDNTLWSWGNQNRNDIVYGGVNFVTSPRQIMTNVIDFAYSKDGCYVIKTDYSLWAWGYNSNGQLGTNDTISRKYNEAVRILDNVKKVSANEHGLALQNDGKLWAWGSNSKGQIGDNSTTYVQAPKYIMNNVIDINVVDYSSYVIKSDNSLLAWGALRDYSAAAYSTINTLLPKKMFDNVKVMYVNGYLHILRNDNTLWGYEINSQGLFSSGLAKRLDNVALFASAVGNFAIRKDGTLWAWGSSNGEGELGDGRAQVRAIPFNVMDGVRSIGVNGGNYGQCNVLTKENKLLGWGSNYYGTLKESNEQAITKPVERLNDVKEISPNNTLVITNGGSLMQWANYDSNNKVNASIPKKISINAKSIETAGPNSGVGECLVIDSNGSIWNWYRNNQPVQTMSNVKRAIKSKTGHVLALKEDGILWGYGSNKYGELGIGTESTVYIDPVEIMRNVKDFACGENYSLVLDNNGVLWSCGRDYYGGLGLGSTASIDTKKLNQVLTGVSSVYAYMNSSFVIKTNNELWAFGVNYERPNMGGTISHLGDGTTDHRSTPVFIASDVKKIVFGRYHKLIIKTDNSLWGWGYNNYGEVGIGYIMSIYSPLKIMDNVLDAAAGYDHSIVLTTEGKVWTFGQNIFGQSGDGLKSDYSVPAEIMIKRSSKLQPLSNAKSNFAVLEYNNSLYTAGGKNYYIEGVPAKTEIFDSNTNKWSGLNNLITPRWDLGLAKLDVNIDGNTRTNMFAFGGTQTGTNNRLSNKLEMYDFTTGQWTAKTSILGGRSGMSVASVNNKMYVIGGFAGRAGGGITRRVDVYNPLTNSWSAAAQLLTPRANAAVAVINNKIYVFGGIYNDEIYLNDVEEYDPVANSWRTMTSMPTPRSSFGATTANGKIYTAGGFNGANLDTVEIFDPLTGSGGTWTTGTRLQIPRCNIGIVTLNNTPYVIGGINYNFGGYLDNVEEVK